MNTEWQDDAACRGRDTNIFMRQARQKEARAICAKCPVLAECREWNDAWEGDNVTQNSLIGIFAGESPGERCDRRIAARDAGAAA